MGPGGTTTAETQEITIVAGPGIEFTATPDRVASGGSVTLSWKTTNATSIVIKKDDNNNPNVHTTSASSGRVTVNPMVGTTYTLEATGNGITNTATVSVEIIPPPTVDSFSPDPFNVELRGLVNLTWTTTDATSLVISDGTKTVYSTNTAATSGTAPVYPDADTTYTLTAKGPGGTSEPRTTLVTIDPPTVDTFTADPDPVTLGGRVTLTWTTTSAKSITIEASIDGQTSNVYGPSTETQAKSGSFTVTPTADTIYTLTATGPTGTDTRAIDVRIAPPVDSFTASSDSVMMSGDRVTLRWQTTGATSVAITDNDANTIDETVYAAATRPDSSFTVTVTTGTTYTLTATGPNTSVSDTVTVTITG